MRGPALDKLGALDLADPPPALVMDALHAATKCRTVPGAIVGLVQVLAARAAQGLASRAGWRVRRWYGSAL